MSEKDYNHDVRSECLGSINAVQDLIHQYSEMNDEEKTRIAGVKGYLEDQLAFLIKQLISLDEVSTETSFDENSASGLELNYNIKNLKPHEKYKTNNQLTKIRKKRYKPKIIHKFIKNTTMKKHTTQTNFDSLQMTEPSARDKIKINNLLQNVDDKMQKDNKFEELSDELVEKVDDFQAPVGDKTETGSDRMKRNIKDVYYKAVHDATKYTEKTMHPHYAGTKT
ncbi:uncharacterized protein LOC113238785 [Hyposmocoma kahamanoa]|uniref:uncharacterized protein LOC113238785 n=1 Tax=Hyposmocoma kahamanoa TaxID=1477025 RepID=UPI000E6D7E83|nr:uncharacterized protein LOC113238785 [Hyposmocoma kahamanoa]